MAAVVAKREGPLFISEAAVRGNTAILDYCRTSVSELSGATAGILGLAGLYGFIFYLLASILLSLLLIKYFKSRRPLFTGGLIGGLFTYVLFWTFLYGGIALALERAHTPAADSQEGGGDCSSFESRGGGLRCQRAPGPGPPRSPRPAAPRPPPASRPPAAFTLHWARTTQPLPGLAYPAHSRLTSSPRRHTKGREQADGLAALRTGSSRIRCLQALPTAPPRYAPPPQWV
ncbi:PREDICTED: uncharacterized protein LOC102859911 [Elephantulus edwardii]|uniref:uncharacterized protein LOC102859911 n=1 Tax=Elephantulus edwardii TaxID=28737 RepID=UPI0003F0919F|nr:PREDICTED: uncharacterized protein LOC102859911 [Elephantulus edwardii]